jgi:hypothetical protein
MSVEEEVRGLQALSLNDLRKVWEVRFGAPPPIRSADMLRLALAWRIQAQAHGGLSRTARDALSRTGRVVAEGQELGCGATLKRVWNGQEQVVRVVEGGFAWNGCTFRSLSAVATEIAGARWNGPRFFGLRP